MIRERLRLDQAYPSDFMIFDFGDTLICDYKFWKLYFVAIMVFGLILKNENFILIFGMLQVGIRALV